MNTREHMELLSGDPPTFAARTVLSMLARIERGRIEVGLPDRSRLTFGSGTPAARIDIAEWSVFAAVLARGDIGFAEAYLDGRWTTPDLPGLLTVTALNRTTIDRAIYGGFPGRLVCRILQALNANTRRGSRRNIAAHYDLGNDFYGLWLDPSMTYSSALFGGDSACSLESGQAAKYRRILERLAPAAGNSILEVGCGWGGFAELAARDYGCRVTGLTLSREQLRYAEERMRRAGVAGLAKFDFRDYRDERGSYDFVVSIEMIEAVGERYWPDFFAMIARSLKRGGRAIVQAITIADELFDRYRKGADFIRQYVFPGGMLPSPSRFRAEAQAAGLALADALAFGQDYAETLRHWRRSFGERRRELRSLGYDERFARLWDFYLAYCEAGFATACTDVHQFDLLRPR